MASSFTLPKLIELKQKADVLTCDQIEWFVNQVATKKAHDAQVGAMLMAIFLQGMTKEETAALTSCMTKSGEVLSWPEEWKHLVVDKHSTGGVGDKISLVLAPALAACGVKVPMISGRSLGFTGGTLDKLESIPGYNVRLTSLEMVNVLEKVGCCIVSQTDSLVPADKVLYALRDITNTVASLPLIVSSIVSKKMAEGLTSLVLDVKYGRGSFSKTIDDAKRLAFSLAATSQSNGVKTTAFVTDMDYPLGFAIGNSLEVVEVIDCLKGNGPEDILELVTCQGGELLHLNGRVDTYDSGKKEIEKVIKNGEALTKFQMMLASQGVGEEIIRSLCADPKSVLSISCYTTDLFTTAAGVVTDIDASLCAEVSTALGSGRLLPSDSVKHDTGLRLHVKCGSQIEANKPWVTVYHSENGFTPELKSKLEQAISVGDGIVTTTPKVNFIIRDCSLRGSVMPCQ